MDLFDMVNNDRNSMAGRIQQVTCPTLVMGVQSDILFPIQQQREIVELLKESGNEGVSYYELNALYGQ
jgi:homoserine O-acetyltransferase